MEILYWQKKKVLLSLFPVVRLEITKRPKKYRKMTIRIIDELISNVIQIY